MESPPSPWCRHCVLRLKTCKVFTCSDMAIGLSMAFHGFPFPHFLWWKKRAQFLVTQRKRGREQDEDKTLYIHYMQSTPYPKRLQKQPIICKVGGCWWYHVATMSLFSPPLRELRARLEQNAETSTMQDIHEEHFEFQMQTVDFQRVCKPSKLL